MNIDQFKKDMENGVLVCRESWKELIEHASHLESEVDRLMMEYEPSNIPPEQLARWAEHQYRHVPNETQGKLAEPDEAKKLIEFAEIKKEMQKLDRAGIGQPSMIPPGNVGIAFNPPHIVVDIDWMMCERISNEDHVDEALRAFKEDPTADNAAGLIQAALTVYVANNAHIKPLPADAGLPIDADPFAAPRPAPQAPGAIPVDLLAAHIADGKHVPRPMRAMPEADEQPETDYSPDSFYACNAFATMVRQGDNACFDASEEYLTKRLRRFEYKFGEFAGMKDDDKGSFVRFTDVCMLFGIDM